VAARSKVWIRGRSLARIAVSKPAGRMCYVSVVSVVCCQVRSVRLTDHSSRGVVPNVCF